MQTIIEIDIETDEESKENEECIINEELNNSIESETTSNIDSSDELIYRVEDDHEELIFCFHESATSLMMCLSSLFILVIILNIFL